MGNKVIAEFFMQINSLHNFSLTTTQLKSCRRFRFASEDITFGNQIHQKLQGGGCRDSDRMKTNGDSTRLTMVCRFVHSISTTPFNRHRSVHWERIPPLYQHFLETFPSLGGGVFKGKCKMYFHGLLCSRALTHCRKRGGISIGKWGGVKHI